MTRIFMQLGRLTGPFRSCRLWYSVTRDVHEKAILKRVRPYGSGMSAFDVVAYAVHLLFAGLWTGSVLFVAYAVLPAARDGELSAGLLDRFAGKLTTVSRASAALLFLTGGHLAAQRYTVDSLTGSLAGYNVLAMLALWFVLAGLVEVGTSKLTDGTGRDKVREPAAAARPFLLGASATAVLLLFNAGLLFAVVVGLV